MSNLNDGVPRPGQAGKDGLSVVQGRDSARLISDRVAQQTTSSLAALSQAANRRAREVRDPHVDDTTTVSDLVGEAITPYLQAWLDKNLAPLIEKIAQEEIRRLIRRAEDNRQ